MPHFSGCRVTCVYEDGRPACEDDDADVQIDAGRMLLSYWDESGVVVLVGGREDSGDFELLARSRPRRCTLKQRGARRFAGTWSEGDERGSLEIEIPAADAVRMQETR